jgi:hypothetical protein
MDHKSKAQKVTQTLAIVYKVTHKVIADSRTIWLIVKKNHKIKLMNQFILSLLYFSAPLK